MPEGLTINQAAQALGVSPRQVRRYIREGKIQAELAPGKHGATYLITSVPPIIPGQKTRAKTLDKNADSAMVFVKELQRENMQLAHQLGQAQERIRTLEQEIKLLTAPKPRWWKRILSISRR